MDSFDRIEKRVVLRAPRSRVWQAIANAKEFGRWFGVTLNGEFAEGVPIMGTFSSFPSEAVIMDHQARLGLKPSRVRLPVSSIVFCTPERIEPERYFSFRWIPYGIYADADRHAEPTTLVEFHLITHMEKPTDLTCDKCGKPLVMRWGKFGTFLACTGYPECTYTRKLTVDLPDVEPPPEGTLLTIVESGFERVPAHRRERAFRMNDGGWAAQADNVRQYVEAA